MVTLDFLKQIAKVLGGATIYYFNMLVNLTPYTATYRPNNVCLLSAKAYMYISICQMTFIQLNMMQFHNDHNYEFQTYFR